MVGLLCPTAAQALSRPVETTLRVLLDEYGSHGEDNVLLELVALKANLEAFGLRCEPGIGLLGLDEPRVVSSGRPSSLQVALEEIAGGESAAVEFKSSLVFDRRRFLLEPGGPLDQYKLDALVHSCLKTVAAFANTDGGVLYVGVEDNTNVCGLAEDFALTNSARRDYDGWEQFLRGQVEARFIDGRSVNPYIHTEALVQGERTFVRVQTTPRSELTFLRKPGGASELYVRYGTRSAGIEYQDIHKHYEMRRKF